jgi:hypothetical protein
VRHDSPTREDGAEEIDPKRRFPLRPVDVLDAPLWAVDAGVVDEDVDPSKGIERPSDDALDVVGHGYVGDLGEGCIAELSLCASERGRVARADADARPGLDKGVGDGETETLACARDDCEAVVERAAYAGAFPTVK